MKWKAHPKSKVVFRLSGLGGVYHPDIVPPGGVTIAENKRLCTAILKTLGLKFKEYTHYEVALSNPMLAEFLETVKKSQKTGKIGLTSCWIEEPAPSASDVNAWFELEPGPSEFKSPTRPPANSQFSWADGRKVASQLFKDVIAKHKLTGLEWLPLEDSSPSDPATWHEVFSLFPIGRGIDHPLLDSKKVSSAKLRDGLIRSRRIGESTAWMKWWRKDIEFIDPLIPELIRLSTPHFKRLFRVQGPERFAREYLPATDFAYNGWDFDADKTSGHEGRFGRAICCNARARQLLIDSGVMKPSRFRALETVAAADANALILDRTIKSPLPLPAYTKAEAATERSRRMKLLKNKPAKKTIRTFRTTNEALKELKRRSAAGTLPWKPAANATAFDKIQKSSLFGKTPRSWQALAPWLPLRLELQLDSDNRFDFLLSKPRWNDWLRDDADVDPEDMPSKHDLILAETPYGDWFAVRKSDPLMPNDGRIVHWDHETTLIADEWPTIAAFAGHLLHLSDKHAKPS